MVDSSVRKRSSAKSRYLMAALSLTVAVSISGWALNSWMTDSASIPLSTSAIEKNAGGILQQTFATAVRHMQQGQYRQALKLWHQALLLAPDLPEVQVNMGFSLYELGEYATARDFFISAMEQNAYQANAYYGLAIVSEKMGDLEGALGAMRSYIHLAAGTQDDPFLRRARSALWEWESLLAQNLNTQDSAVDKEQTGYPGTAGE